MRPRIAVFGAGAIGGYVGGHLARAGQDVTLIDPWPEHVEAIRARGLEITGMTAEEHCLVQVPALHLTEVQSIARQRPIDIAFVSVKSYDTVWATAMIAQYLAEGGYVVSLQNCINEERIAGVVGWGRTVGMIAATISAELVEAGRIVRTGPRGGTDGHAVFRVGEVHGRITDRAKQVGRLVDLSDSTKVTDNLWGERWSKLVTNGMANGMSACTGLISRDILLDDTLRHFTARLGSEAIRTGQALGYALEEIHHLDPEIIARAGEGDAEAKRAYDEHRLAEARKPGGGAHRPSMGQDMVKGRRTEIESLNGFIVAKAKEVGIATPANAALTEIVKQVEKGTLQPDPRHIKELRLN